MEKSWRPALGEMHYFNGEFPVCGASCRAEKLQTPMPKCRACCKNQGVDWWKS